MDKNEAIKILKDFHDESAIFSVRTALETLHPEFAKSEDERIKEAIIDTIHLYYGEPLEDEAKEMIAWLEKQDHKKHEEELDAAYKTADSVQYKRGYEAARKELEELRQQPRMQNGITINGVEYELIEDDEADECERCALREICHNSNEVICIQLFENLYAHHRFKKR